MNTIDLKEKFAQFNEFWSPKIVGELNGQLVKLAKLKGETVETKVYLIKSSTKIKSIKTSQ